jgi:hypothetical protein
MDPDPDPRGPKTRGSGFGSATLPDAEPSLFARIQNKKNLLLHFT